MNYHYRDSRDEIILSWFQNGEKALVKNNLFEAFIYLWIAWVVSCKRFNDSNFQNDYVYENKDTDRDEIKRYCITSFLRINEILKLHKDSLNFLANRKGSNYKMPIIDVKGKLNRIFNDLSRDLNGEIDLTERQRAEYFAELLNKIRNNLFHGDKVYDDANDRELIRHTVYILRDFVKLEIPA
jgi:hypothetical protein